MANKKPRAKGFVQLLLATGMTVAGVVLLIMAFITPPEGKIDSSVLVAFGEILTFAGAILGIDYHYKARL